MMHHMIFLLAMAALFFTGCLGDGPNITFHGSVLAIVKDVRVTTEAITENTGKGNPAGGAFGGGLIFGLPGAIAGAAIESSRGSVITTNNRVLACSFQADIDNGITRGISLKFVSIRDSFSKKAGLEECTLLRNGDRIKVFVLRWSDGKTEYGWNGATPTDVEIRPKS